MYLNLEHIFQALFKNIIIYEKYIQSLFVTVKFFCFAETIPVEESRGTVSQIPSTSIPWLFLSFCGAAVITKPESCSCLIDYSEYVA